MANMVTTHAKRSVAWLLPGFIISTLRHFYGTFFQAAFTKPFRTNTSARTSLVTGVKHPLSQGDHDALCFIVVDVSRFVTSAKSTTRYLKISVRSGNL
jgi:hypothetical protein